MPSKPLVRPADQTEKPGSAEEKKPPFGFHKLKPVSKTVPKDSESDKHSVPVKPSDNKSSEPESPAQKSRKGSVDSDVKNVKPESKSDDKVTKKSSITEASAEKPHAVPRPSGLLQKFCVLDSFFEIVVCLEYLSDIYCLFTQMLRMNSIDLISLE